LQNVMPGDRQSIADAGADQDGSKASGAKVA
jgi:hypothetical protein